MISAAWIYNPLGNGPTWIHHRLFMVSMLLIFLVFFVLAIKHMLFEFTCTKCNLWRIVVSCDYTSNMALSYNKQEMLTLRCSPGFTIVFWWGPCCSLFLFPVLWFVVFVLCLVCPMLPMSLYCLLFDLLLLISLTFFRGCVLFPEA